MAERFTVPAGEVDPEAGVVRTGVGEVPLTERERDLLLYLRAQEGRVVSREELLERVWGYDPRTRSRTVDTTVGRLRAKIELDPATPRLLHTVRGGGYRLGAPDEPRLVARARPAPVLPFPRLDRIVGRAAELREASALLHAGHRLVTLTGPPGVGKTWLARSLGTTIGDLGRRVVWFVDLSEARGPEAVSDAVAEALDLPRPLGRAERAVGEALAALGPSVGAIDDAQGLDPSAAALLSAWLRGAPELSLVVTSQRLLGLEGEHRIAVEPLEPAAAAELLRDRLAALGAPAPSAEEVQAVVRRVEGLPLAIELAAPALDVLSPTAWLASPAWLAPSRPDAPPRHRSLDAAVGAAVALLADEVRTVLLRLSVFAGPFPPELAGAVLEGADVLEALVTLRRRSLLRREPDGRLALYGAVREWARARIGPEERARAAEAHAGHLLRLPFAALAPLRAELVQALVEGPIASRGPLAALLVTLVGRTGPLELAPPVLERALRGVDDPHVRAQVTCHLADALRMAGRPEAAEGRAREALALADGAPAIRSRALVELTNALSKQERHAEAVACGREGVAVVEGDAGARHELCVALNALATTLADAGDPEASEVHERAGALAVELGRTVDAAIAVGNAGAVLHQIGRSEEALARYARALEIVGDRHPRFAAVVRMNQANALKSLGDLDAAERAYEEAGAALRAVGDPVHAATVEVLRATIDAARGDRARAIRRLRRALRAPEMRPVDRRRAEVHLGVLTGDLAPGPDPDPLRRAGLALLAGAPMPSDTPADDAEELALLGRGLPGARRRSGPG